MNENVYTQKKLLYIIIMTILAVVLLVLAAVAGFTSGNGPELSQPTSSDGSEISSVSEEGLLSDPELSSDEDDPSLPSEGSSVPDTSSVSEPYPAESSEPVSEISAEESSSEISEEPSEETSGQGIPEWKPYTVKTTGKAANGKAFPSAKADSVSAEYVAVYNVTKGEFIYVKNGGAKAYPASMTKLITAMLAEKYLDKDEEIVVGKEIELVKPHSSLAYLYVNEKLPLETVLDAMLLPSGNDAAYVVGVNVGRKLLGDPNASLEACLEAFCKEANRFVSALGCKHTHITCPDGFHDDAHYSTAADFALISAEVVKNYPLVKKVCAKKRAKDGYKLDWTNTNNMLEYSYVNGLKTGSTGEAGYCISISARAEDTDIIIIIMNCKTAAARTSDAKTLLSCAFGWY